MRVRLVRVVRLFRVVEFIDELEETFNINLRPLRLIGHAAKLVGFARTLGVPCATMWRASSL